MKALSQLTPQEMGTMTKEQLLEAIEAEKQQQTTAQKFEEQGIRVTESGLLSVRVDDKLPDEERQWPISLPMNKWEIVLAKAEIIREALLTLPVKQKHVSEKAAKRLAEKKAS